MAKNSILDYSSTANSNTDIGGIGIQGTNAVNNFDDAFRTLMAQMSDWTNASTIVSGTTTDLSTVTGAYVTVSGTSTITSFGTAKAGWMKYLRFSGAANITHNATSMILPGAENISTSPGDYAIFVSEGSGNWRCLEYFSTLSGIRPTPKGHIYGLTLSNNATDPTNDIDIAVGECASDSAIPSLIILKSALTKRLDAAWAVGSGNGGLDSGVIANVTYYIWLIQRSDTGVVDALFSQSPTSPVMPTNYDRKRRIGSIIRDTGAIVPFTQIGKIFWFKTKRLAFSSTATLAATSRSMLVPTAIPTKVFLRVRPISTAGNVFVVTGNDDFECRADSSAYLSYDVEAWADTTGQITLAGTGVPNGVTAWDVYSKGYEDYTR